MTDQITIQANQALATLANAEVPAELRAIAQQGVTKARDTYAVWAAATRAGVNALEEIAGIAHAAAWTVGEKVAGQVATNTEAAFAAAEKIARAGTVAEAAKLQAEFAQDRLAAAGVQGKELIELTAKVAQEATTAVNAAAKTAATAVKLVA